jgi:Flp pilus assembly protein TadB
MAPSLELAVFGLISLVGLGLLTANSLLRSFKWLDPNPSLKDDDPARNGDAALKANWKRLTVYSAVTGVIFGLAALVVNSIYGWNQQSIVFASLGGYVFFQSIFTDFRVRNVDRHGQRIANFLALATGAYILSLYGSQFDWLVYLAFVAATFAIGLLPGVGNSDGRAFVFLVLATYPVAGIAGMQWSAVLFLVTIIAYYLGMSIWKREFTFKGLLTKVSFPMVPLIMVPALLVTLIGRLFPGF